MSDLRDDPSPEAAFLRDLVRAEEADLPSDDKMNELVARLAPVISKPAASASRAKFALSTAVVVVAIAGAWLATSSRSELAQEKGPAVPALAAVPSVTPVASHVSTPDVHIESPPALPSIDVSALPSAAASTRTPHVEATPSGCTGEVALLDQADAALRSGSADRALSLTRDHAARCPSGAFTQERERIAIEALANLGRIDEMRTRAQAFERNFPASPHLRRIERVVDKYRDR
ncbi:hypothetical protein AKJ09_01350 [Labilithrix luteola]|uniref:Outer membrane lipoprotein BamD-like domain-containing protein n=1 Tax=Labilithrix luteola TaxID=1391654 RepID=A0A0K1PMQ3_9BACT|nr:hypothetical protein [Labilithrix luteola]AKU94686.1 hypothetical protein AKJ09_01350 [Labilithrix luteola]